MVIINGTTGVNKVNDSAVVYDSELASQVSTQLYGFKNYLINGNFDVQQRGASFTNTASGKQYTLDMWSTYYYDAASNVSIAAQAGEVSPNAVKLGRVNGSAVTSALWLMQAIESVNTKKLKGKTVTLSFWAKKGSGFSGALEIYVRQGTGVDEDWSAYTGVTNTTSTITLTTNLQNFSYTFTVGTITNEMAVGFRITSLSGVAASDYIVVENVQLEEGSIATPFEQRPYGLELSMCQRYYEKTGSNNETFGGGRLLTTSTMQGVTAFFKVPKRIVPTVTVYSPAGTVNTMDFQGAGSLVPNTVMAVDRVSLDNFGITMSGLAGQVVGQAAYCIGGFTASAEL